MHFLAISQAGAVIGGLFGKSLIQKDEGIISLTSIATNDLNSRQSLYEIELNNLSSAQADLLKDKYNLGSNIYKIIRGELYKDLHKQYK